MRGLAKAIVVAVVAVGFIEAGADVAAASSSPQPDLPGAVAAAAAAEAYVDVRNSALVGGFVPNIGADRLSVPFAAGLRAKTSSDVATLVARRQVLAAQGERYSRSLSKSTVRSVTRSGAHAEATVEEDTRLYYVRTVASQPEYTEFIATREFTFDPSPTGWTLTGARLLPGTGPLPINDVGSAPTAVATPSESAGAPGPSSSITRPRSDAAPASPTAKSGASGAALAPEASNNYNYSAMVNYEKRWWNARNPAYRHWSDDCTDFLSQALSAGGWSNATGWYLNNNAWWYNFLNQSRTWVNADSWYRFATGSGRTSILSNVWFMDYGDVLQADWSRDGTIDHSMMVTAISGSQIYLTYHTNDTLNRSLGSILAANPGANWYAHRT